MNRLIEIFTVLILLVYFVDIQRDGKLDLHHVSLNEIAAKLKKMIE